jgi:hypothetical protein
VGCSALGCLRILFSKARCAKPKSVVKTVLLKDLDSSDRKDFDLEREDFNSERDNFGLKRDNYFSSLLDCRLMFSSLVNAFKFLSVRSVRQVRFKGLSELFSMDLLGPCFQV